MNIIYIGGNMKYYFLFVILVMAVFSQADSSCQDILRSLSNWKKPRDTLKFIDIPRTNEEQELKRRGHREQFYAGVDEVHSLIRLGNALRENSIDPQRTHIENFVPLIARHFQHLKEGWQYYAPTRLGPPQRLSLRASKIGADLNYRILRHPVASYIGSAVWFILTQNIRKTDQPLSLETWQNLNFWWSALMHPTRLSHEMIYEMYMDIEEPGHRQFRVPWFVKKKDNEEITEEEFTQYSWPQPIPFPETVVLPTISHFGVFAINQVAGGDRVVPLELSNRVVKVDRTLQSPFDVFYHDLSHIHRTNYGQPLLDNPLFHQHLMSYLTELSPKKREQAEIIYFILVHESPGLTKDFPSIGDITDKQTLLNILSSSFSAQPPFYLYTAGRSPSKSELGIDPNKSVFDQHREYLKKIRDINKKKEQEYMDSLPPEIRDFFNQSDIVTDIFKNPQLFEESAEVFIQAVQHVLQHHPDII